MTRAVITGVGAASALGVGFDALVDGLAAGRAGVGPIGQWDASAFPVRVAGEVPAADEGALPRAVVEAWTERGWLRDRKVRFAALAAAEAWRRAGCDEGDAAAARLSLALGLEQAFLDDFVPGFDGATVILAGPDVAGGGRGRGDAAVRNRSAVDLGARAVVELLDLGGAVTVHASACAAGALAVAHAASLIERGAAEIVLCGASDSMLGPLGVGGMWLLGTTSPRHAPDACRPFDRRRDGLALGEGAALFVVEDEARARARGARPLARVLGWGSTQDAHRHSAPHPDGEPARRAMARALERARLRPADIGYVNAHGTGTALNDPAEARALRRLLGAHDPPVSSIKGAVGHLMSASGAIELAASLLAFERDLLPGTAHHEERDPECEIAVLGPAPLATRVDVVLSNSFGFGGQNAAVLLGRP